jgi:hypothetical protein
MGVRECDALDRVTDSHHANLLPFHPSPSPGMVTANLSRKGVAHMPAHMISMTTF